MHTSYKLIVDELYSLVIKRMGSWGAVSLLAQYQVCVWECMSTNVLEVNLPHAK